MHNIQDLSINQKLKSHSNIMFVMSKLHMFEFFLHDFLTVSM